MYLSLGPKAYHLLGSCLKYGVMAHQFRWLFLLALSIPSIAWAQNKASANKYELRLQTSKNARDSAKALLRLAENQKESNIGQSKEYLKEAENVIRKLEDADLYFRLSLIRVKIMMEEGFHERSLTMLDSAFLNCERDSVHPLFYADAIKVKGQLLFRLQKFDEAKQAYQEAYKYYEDLNDTLGLGFSARGLGSIARRTGDLGLALQHTLTALDYLKAIDHQKGVANVMNSLGLIYFEIGEIDKARQTHEEVRDLHRKLGNRSGEANALSNIGAILAAKDHQYEKSIEYFKLASEIYNDLGSTSRMATINYEIGVSYKNLKRPKDALHHYQICESAMMADNLPLNPMLLLSMGELYAQTGKPDLAYSYLSRGMHKAENSGEITLLENAQELAALSYASLGDYQKAYQVQADLKATQDSIFNEKMMQQYTELETLHQTRKKEEAIAQLEFDRKLNEAKLSRQRDVILVVVAAAILLLLLLWHLLKLNKRIRDQNHAIASALKDKEVLLREIHHRVKNNLQLISSLLSLQSYTIKDASALEALSEGQSRVQSMALIHQDLYRTDNLTGVGVEGYIRKLCQNLFNTYNISGDRIQLNLDIESLALDVSTLIPLGLILNELISNSLKYAFPNDRSGSIGIVLKQQGEKLRLKVWDDGKGYTASARSDGFGHKLVNTFAKKLQADVHIKHDTGTVVSMNITNFKLAS